MPELKQSRIEALALDKNISVTAGAGSGKTNILVERYLKIVADDPQKVRRTLAITFTKKAAGEMQERVAEEVNRRLLKEKNNAQRRKLLQVRDQLNSASISTIHGFCSKLLREFPLEAGLPPDFMELDKIKSVVYTQEAIKKAFEELNTHDKPEEIQKWLPLFTCLSRAAITKMLQNALAAPYEMEQILNRFQKYTPETYLQFLEEQYFNMLKQIIGEISFTDFYKLADQISALDTVNNKSEKGGLAFNDLLSFKNAYDKDRSSLKTHRAFIELVDRFTTNDSLPYKNLQALGGKKSWDDSCTDLIVSLSEISSQPAKQTAQFKPGAPPGEIDKKWFGLFERFIELYQNCRVAYSELKEEQGAVDFEDLQILALKLLKENEPARREFYNRFDFIMVDEFQDTNDLQWQIITQLASNDGCLDKDKVFVVGDPKQSIYGFRSADIRIFKKVKQLFAQSAGFDCEEDYCGNVVFKESFRFLPRLNGFINHLFKDVLQEQSGNQFEVGYHSLKAMRDLAGKGWVELGLFDSEDDTAKTEAAYIAESIAGLIKNKNECFKWRDEREIKEDIQYGDIAILLRSRQYLLEIEQALRKKDIAFKTVGGIGYWQRQEIFDFYHLLRFLSNPADDFALIGALRSKMFMIPDSALFLLAEESGYNYLQKLNGGLKQTDYSQKERAVLEHAAELINKWLECRERMNLSDLLNMIMQDVQLKAVLAAELNGGQLAANVDKLIEQAQSFDAAGLGGLQDFINNVDEFIAREIDEGEAQTSLEDSSTVKIMTIHASKGLQFPVVFVPFLNTKKRGVDSGVYLDAELGLAAKINIPAGKEKSQDHTLINLIKYKNHQKESAEAKRLFYVAATRASNYLFLSASLKKDNPEANSAISWMFECFQRDGIDLLESGQFDFDDFSIDIRRSYETDPGDKQDFIKFDKGMRDLRMVVKKQDTCKPERIPDFLHPLTSEIGARTFSATLLMTYIKDRDAYYQRYHLGFFENDYETFAEDVYKADHSLLKGKIVHRYLELQGESMLNEDQLIGQILFEYDVFDAALQKQFKEDILELSVRMAKSDTGKKIIQAKEARNEISITMRLGADYFTGTLDRIYRNDHNEWEVVDYKTNRIRADQLKEEGEKYKWQIKAYALLLSRLYPDQEKYPVSLYFLLPDRLYNKVFTKQEVEETAILFLDTIEEIKDKIPVELVFHL